jgi:acyl-CoA thioester hydrolase
MLEGHISDGIHHLHVRVYYEDTDFSGHVYHANYLKFCERGRSDYLRLLGIDQNVMAGGNDAQMFVVRRMKCEFLRPARFDDVLEVETTAGELSGARFTLTQRVLRQGDVVFTSEVVVALIDNRGKPRRVPPEWRLRLSETVK